MGKKILENFKDDFFMLVEAGFVAVNAMDEDSAFKLFKAAEALNSTNMFPKVGYGYLYMCKLELKQAERMFRKALEKEPNNEVAKTLLGLTLSMHPNKGSEGEKMLEGLKKSEDKEIKNLAGDSLTFVDEFIKKKPTPMDVQKNAGKRSKK